MNIRDVLLIIVELILENTLKWLYECVEKNETHCDLDFIFLEQSFFFLHFSTLMLEPNISKREKTLNGHTFKVFSDLPRTSFFTNFLMLLQNGNYTQEDLIKFDYKKNKKIENLGILLHGRTY